MYFAFGLAMCVLVVVGVSWCVFGDCIGMGGSDQNHGGQICMLSGG